MLHFPDDFAEFSLVVEALLSLCLSISGLVLQVLALILPLAHYIVQVVLELRLLISDLVA